MGGRGSTVYIVCVCTSMCVSVVCGSFPLLYGIYNYIIIYIYIIIYKIIPTWDHHLPHYIYNIYIGGLLRSQ